MKPVLFPVAPSTKSAELIRPVPEAQTSANLLRPSIEDLHGPGIATVRGPLSKVR